MHIFFRSSLLCAIIVATTVPAPAQRILGFRFGLNVAGVTGDVSNAEAFGTRTGFVAGLFGSIPLRYSLAIQPELLYAQKGFTTEGATLNGSNGGVIPAAFELTYLEFPLLIKYGLPLSAATTVSVYAGPTFSFELSERVVLDELQGSQEIDQFASQDLGAAFGGDVELPFATFDAVFGIRYTRSVRSVINDGVSPSNEVRIYNEVVSFFIGFHL